MASSVAAGRQLVSSFSCPDPPTGRRLHNQSTQGAFQETDFLGHWLTLEGVRPWTKKIEAILRLQPPVNVKQLRSFLGMVNYYRDMWPRRTHVLAPLTEFTNKHTFIWMPKHQQAFERMKILVAADALLVFPDHSLPFDVEMDASEYQLGSAIKQQSRLVA